MSLPNGADLATAPGWAKTGGAHTVTGNASGGLDITVNGSSQHAAYLYETYSVAHAIEASITTTVTSFPLVVAALDYQNFVGARIIAGAATIEVQTCVAGVFTQVFRQVADAGSAPGTWRLEARADGTWALLLRNRPIDGAPAVGVASGAIPAGLLAATKCGISPRDGANRPNCVSLLRIWRGQPPRGLGISGGWTIHQPVPRAVASAANNTTIFGTTKVSGIGTTGGLARIHQINHTTGAIGTYTVASGTTWSDDHGHPTFVVRPDGRLITFYVRHSETDGVKARISVNPWDASAWSSEFTFYAPGVTAMSYGAPVVLSSEGTSGRVYVFFRLHRSPRSLAYVTSDNVLTATAPASDGAAAGAVTSSAAVILAEPGGHGIYCNVWSNGVDRIDVFGSLSGEPSNPTKNDARHIYYSAGAWRTSSGASLGALPTVFTDWTPVALTADLGEIWNRDMFRDDATGRIYATFDTVPERQLQRRYYAVWDGAAWAVREVPGAGSYAMTAAAQTRYTPGSALDPYDIGTLYLSIGDADASTLWRYRTTDDGVTWTREQVSRNAIVNARLANQHVRPTVPRDRVQGCGVLWLSGWYDDFVGPAGYSLWVNSAPAR